MGKRKKLRKAKPTADQLRERRASRKFKSDIRTVLVNSGFTHIATRDTNFDVAKRTGEFDGLYAHENILLILEETETGDQAKILDHLRKKLEYIDHLHKHVDELFNVLSATFSGFANYLSSHKEFSTDDFKIVFVYCSRNAIDAEHRERYDDKCVFLGYSTLQYFVSLTKTIKRSARFELFKFLRLELSDVGLASSGKSTTTYPGLLLPESPSGLPKGHKLVSFLVDPEMLLKQSYVLRTDGWQDSDCLYQRLLIRNKITEMRKYLSSEHRVFVNNIITTLPPDTEITDSDTNYSGSDKLTRIMPVSITIPQKFNTIGIIDGQHRVFCYHEGDDLYDKDISKLRVKQHLLVTGIIYPPGASVEAKQKFEAKLFLEINDKQKRVRGDLKQAIERIVHPYSDIAIAKAVIVQMGSSGPLAGFLEVHFYDAGKLKTTSIVSYGLKYIVGLESERSLFRHWKSSEKESITKSREVLVAYVKYAASQLNQFFGAFKDFVGPGMWSTDRRVSRALNATTVNGLIYCMRLLIQEGNLGDFASYRKALGKLTVDFTPKKFKYKSSHWRDLGEKIHADCF